MSDYIDREYLVEHIHACMENDRLMLTATKEEILQMVADVPSAEPKHGEWIGGDVPSECSVCGEYWDYKYVEGQEIWYTGELPNFCPNCGADMRGEDE